MCNISSKQSNLAKRLNERLESIIAPKLWIVAAPILMESVSIAEELVKRGARSILAIGVTRGAGDLDSRSNSIQILCLDRCPVGDCHGIIQYEYVLDDLPPHAMEAIDQFDPNREARVMRTHISTSQTFAGRSVFGSRPQAWLDLEDKLIIDDLWDAAGVMHAPSRIINLKMEEAQSAYEALNWGDGVVIAGDNTSGWHGGASKTRWAQSSKHVVEIVTSLGSECKKARVMPLINGVSCSMHGWNTAHEIVSFRPCEMLVSRVPNKDTYFRYEGAATRWTPDPESKVVKQLRGAVEKAGRLLYEQYNYQGTFTVDGIAGEDDNFYPTEINPRFGGALGRINTSLPEIPLLLAHFVCVESGRLKLEGATVPPELNLFGVGDLEQLKSLVISAVETQPLVRTMRSVSCAPPPHQEQVTMLYRLELEDSLEPKWSRLNEEENGLTRDPRSLNQGQHEEFATVLWGKGAMVMAKLPAQMLPAHLPSSKYTLSLLDCVETDLKTFVASDKL